MIRTFKLFASRFVLPIFFLLLGAKAWGLGATACKSQEPKVRSTCGAVSAVKNKCAKELPEIAASESTSEAGAAAALSPAARQCQDEMTAAQGECDEVAEQGKALCADTRDEAKNEEVVAGAKKAEAKKEEQAAKEALGSGGGAAQGGASSDLVAKVQQKREEADRHESQRQFAATVADTAQTTMQIIEAIQAQAERQAAQGKQEAKELEKLSDNINRTTGTPPDRATDGNSNAKKPGQQGGSPSSNPGQGGKPSDQAGGQKKQDEGGGGGMPGGGGGGSPSSQASSPLKVSDPPQDCSNPSVASSNPVCACKLNPTDSRCASILAADKEKSGLAKKANIFTGESEGGGGGFNTSGGGYPSSSAAQKRQASQHGQLEQNAGGSVGKGVGSGQGSGAAAAGKDPKTKAQAYRDQTKSRGGGGGGGGAGGGFSAGSAQANGKIPTTFGRAAGQRGPASVANTKDLRAQMQAQFNARRYPAGTVGPDGITGKHTDQFKKIRSRYAEIMGY